MTDQNKKTAEPDFADVDRSEVSTIKSSPGDEEEIVNEQEQNEVVNDEESAQTTNGTS